MRARIAEAALVLVLTSPLAGQARGVEVGFDGVVQRQLSEDAGKYTAVGLPGSSALTPFAGFRVGFPVGAKVRLEPGFGFSNISVDDFDASLHAWHLMFGAVWDIGSGGGSFSPYLRPFAGYSNVGDDDDSSGFMEFGLGVGGRFRIADRMAIRLELNYAHGLENEDDFIAAQDFINLRFGVSMFTK